ncbi:MAG TPA: alanine racemase [Verrucomicrobia bacterium]|nr:MAG: alanine racemase [Lentisphaerae bacterium GWF2_57_35]HBA86334.1 alanine racemase [Verrucomicrobiota bacterium]
MSGPWVEIDLKVLEANIRQVRSVLRPETSIVFVVKANAYGHGLKAVAERAFSAGVGGFAVAYVREALELRRSLSALPIFLIGVAEPVDVSALIEHRIVPVLTSLEQARALDRAAALHGRPLPVHVKVDTGMGRLGFPWHEIASVIPELQRLTHLDAAGICTHFASIEPAQPDPAFTQYARFCTARELLEEAWGKPLFSHVSSSLPFLFKHEWDFNAVRPGILLYGYEAGGALDRVTTEPILQWKTHVIQVKTVPAGATIGYGGTHVTNQATDIATISAGYADGYPRALSNKGIVLIGGKRCPVVGRVSMNWITVDVGPSSGTKPGDEVVLIGRQGSASIWADEVAERCDTISYEILTGIHASVERRYVG